MEMPLEPACPSSGSCVSTNLLTHHPGMSKANPGPKDSLEESCPKMLNKWFLLVIVTQHHARGTQPTQDLGECAADLGPKP